MQSPYSKQNLLTPVTKFMPLVSGYSVFLAKAAAFTQPQFNCKLHQRTFLVRGMDNILNFSVSLLCFL